MSSDSPTIFISYSHRDERLKERLATHLSVLRGRLDVWDDRRLRAGDNWYAEIEAAIESADVAVMLISADFLSSDFISKEEVPRLLKRLQEDGLAMVPILVRSCAWKEIPWLSAMQIRPTNARPLTALKGNAREDALSALTVEIVELAGKKTPPNEPAANAAATDAPPMEPPESVAAADDPPKTSKAEQISVEAPLEPSLAWANQLGRDTAGDWASVEMVGIKQRLRWIPPGEFIMGSPESEVGRHDDEGPTHKVTLTHGYWLAETPCTQALWQAVMRENPSHYKSPQRPVENVSFEDCQQFIERLNQQIPGLAARLPSEAEWEYACRAGTSGATWNGELQIVNRESPVLESIAWYCGNRGLGVEDGPRGVGQKRPNPWGLYDMLGNVFEWCQDGWRSYAQRPEVDPEEQEGAVRVARGGSWLSRGRLVRAAYRQPRLLSAQAVHQGFRLVLGPKRGAR